MSERYQPKDAGFWEKYGFYEDELLERQTAIHQAQDNIIKVFSLQPENVPTIQIKPIANNVFKYNGGE